jgi:uncharacterized protein
VLVLAACSGGSPAGSSAGSAAAAGGAPAGSGGAPAGSADAPAGSGGAPAGSGGQPVPSGGGSTGSQDATVRLQRAVATGDLVAVQRAIADGADLERRDRDGRTPLVAATKADRVQVARALLDAGADPDAKDDLQDSAFLYAGAEGLDEILALTLQHGADVRSTNRFGGTALIPASEHAHVAARDQAVRPAS